MQGKGKDKIRNNVILTDFSHFGVLFSVPRTIQATQFVAEGVANCMHLLCFRFLIEENEMSSIISSGISTIS